MFVCACRDWMREACRHESFYKEHEGKLYCILHYPGTEKKEAFQQALQRKLAAKDFDFRGVWFPDDVDFQDFTFSADANFYSAQFSAYADFNDAKFSADADFNDAKFSADADFNDAKFSAYAYFSRAQFSAAAYFSSAQFSAAANFSDAQFSADAYFSDAQFSKVANFTNTQFSKVANFTNTQFSKSAYFDDAIFNDNVSFERTRFIEEDSARGDGATSDNKASGVGDTVETEHEAIKVDFAGASFKDGLSFAENEFAEQVFISFAAATFEKPERVVFHTVTLRPHWFINIDSRKFTFIDVSWLWLDKRDALDREIAALERSEHGHLSRLLNITYRQLAVNAEENNRYEEAANFRYVAMEAKGLRERGGRRSKWDEVTRFLLRRLDWLRQQRLWRAISRFNLSWWYWLMSGYGERVARAFVVLLSIWLLFALIYWTGNHTWWQPRQSARLAAQVSAPQPPPPAAPDATPTGSAAPPAAAVAPLTFPEAVIYSAGVLSLQKPEPLPANKRAKAIVLCETILGPLQAALLALAIRRKFMR
jgi:hypothetical protein